MARQVLPVVGAIVGAIWFNNPQLGYAIGAIEGEAADPEALNAEQERTDEPA